MRTFKVGEMYRTSNGKEIEITKVNGTRIAYTYRYENKNSSAYIDGEWASNFTLVRSTDGASSVRTWKYICYAIQGHNNPKCRYHSKEAAISAAKRLVSRGVAPVYILRVDTVVDVPTPTVTEVTEVEE